MFRNRYALITGGSSGIGKALARQLAQQGAHIGILARRREHLDDAVRELRTVAVMPGQKIESFQADVRDTGRVEQVVADVEGRGLPIDLLVNAAGIAHPGYFQELPLDIFRDTMEINYFGTVHTTRAVVRHMMARRSGHIVNFSSMGGLIAVFGYTAYSSSKFAVRGFSEALRSELKPHGIAVTVVYPPDTDTPQLHAENQIKPFETRQIASTAGVMTADQVAAAALRGVQRKQIMVIPGLESRLLYTGVNALGAATHLVMDYLVRQAQKAKIRQQGQQRG